MDRLVPLNLPFPHSLVPGERRSSATVPCHTGIARIIHASIHQMSSFYLRAPGTVPGGKTGRTRSRPHRAYIPVGVGVSNRHAGSSKLYAKWERAEEQRVRGEGIGPSGRMCCIRLGGEDSSKEVALEWILDRSERTIRVKIWGALQAARSVGTEVRRQQQVWFVRGAARRAWPEQSGKNANSIGRRVQRGVQTGSTF